MIESLVEWLFELSGDRVHLPDSEVTYIEYCLFLYCVTHDD
jgi:hypothetical protein